MRLFEIQDHYTGSFSLMGKSPLIKAKTGREALNKYLKEKGIKEKVKVSADNHVQFGVIPMIEYEGRILIDGRKRASWYQIQYPKL